MIHKLISTVVLLLTVCGHAYSQDSDAGILSIETLYHDVKHHSINLDYIYSTSGKNSNPEVSDITFQSLRLSANAGLFGWTNLWGSIPLNMQKGPLGKVTGIGDLILVVDQKVFEIGGLGLYIDLGAKFATGSSTQGDTLPQAYQSGLGSNDILLNFSLISDAFNVGVGYQLASGRSANEYTRLKRGDDLVFRAGYTVRGKTGEFGGELIAIKRLQESSVLNPLLQGESFVDVPGSDQFQLDALLKARVKFGETFSVVGTLAFPFLKRDVNDDGLTRKITASIGGALEF